MKRCPKCSSLMPDDVLRCIRCGHESHPKPVPAAPQAAGRPAGTAAKAGKVSRMRSGWAIVKQSCRVLMLQKSLLVFPLLSGISCFLLLASFAAGVWASGLAEREGAARDALSWILLFAYYFANYFLIVFFNSALVVCAMMRFRGGAPTVRDGLRAAGGRIRQIAAWALLAATVGVVLRMIESRSQLVGRIVAGLLGAAWTIAAYFVVPVLVVEKLGPFDAFKRSAALLKKTWGESIVSNLGLGFFVSLATFLLLVATGFAAALLALQLKSMAILLAGAGVMLAIVILSALVGSALGSIALTAVYLYAAEGKLPQAFEGARLQGAFRAR